MKKKRSGEKHGGRRQEYAETTRRAVVEAARRLFSERGYFSVKVDDIAAAARVSPATVYAVSGGKHGLLRTLMEMWIYAPIVQSTLNDINELDDPKAVIRTVAATCRSMREEFADIMRVMLATAPHDKAVAESLAIATATYRQAFFPISQRLLKLGVLREGLSIEETVDVFWFYFGYSALFTLHDDNGWTYERAEQWLSEQASRALLGDGATAPTSKIGTNARSSPRWTRPR
jgi:AcrR family transcriptional regulator